MDHPYDAKGGILLVRTFQINSKQRLLVKKRLASSCDEYYEYSIKYPVLGLAGS